MGLSLRSLDIAVLVVGALSYVALKLYRFLNFVFGTPLRVLPGPPISSWVYGNQKDIAAVDNISLPDQWAAQYGKNFVDHEFFMVRSLAFLRRMRALNVHTHENSGPASGRLTHGPSIIS